MSLVLLVFVLTVVLVSFYHFYYELILGNLSCGNSVWPGLRINFSKSGARGSPIRGCFRLENSVCGFLALTKAVNTGPDSRKGLPVTTNSEGLFSPPLFPSRAESEMDKFSSKFLKKFTLSLNGPFCEWVGVEVLLHFLPTRA